jgi:hypothetical protein
MSGKMTVKGGVRKATISAVVKRANGKTEQLGVISRYDKRTDWVEYIKGVFKSRRS